MPRLLVFQKQFKKSLPRSMVNGEFGRRPHNPAFEIIYVYSQKDGSLDLHFRGSYKANRTAASNVRDGHPQAPRAAG
jgi:hypothetical protein